MLKFSTFFVFFAFAASGFAAEWDGVTFRSDGNAAFAVSADGKPVWSATGLLFRERYTPELERFEGAPKPFRDDVPMLQRFGRLHIILEKSLIEPTSGNVLVSLDLATQGKLVFRRDSGRAKFIRFVSLVGDALTIERTDGTTLTLDVATGEWTPHIGRARQWMFGGTSRKLRDKRGDASY